MGTEDWDIGRFDRWSSRYDKSVFQPLFFRRVHSGVLHALSPTPGERILDVGCGTGKLASLIATTGSIVDGVDPAPGMIKQALGSNYGPRTSFAVAAAERLPFEESQFDAAVTAISAHHWKEAPAGFKELARVVRPGGRVLVADIGSLGPVVAAMRRAKMVDPHHHQGWRPRDLANLAYDAGFHSVLAKTATIMGARVVLLSAKL